MKTIRKIKGYTSFMRKNTGLKKSAGVIYHQRKAASVLFCFGFIFFLLAGFSLSLENYDSTDSRIFLKSGKLFDGKSKVKDTLKFELKTAQARELLRRGYSTWNSELMEKARDMFLALLLKEGGDSFYLHYYTAFCDYRLANYYLANGDRNTCARFNDEAKKYLEKAMELDDMSGECHALYAACLGYDIALDSSLGMTLGMESATHFSKAFQKEPESPRVNLLQGISFLYTPEMYGGGLKKAVPLLEKAVSLYEKETEKGPLHPDWGREEALTFLGMTYARKGENDKAEVSFKKALEVNPEFGLAAEELTKLKK